MNAAMLPPLSFKSFPGMPVAFSGIGLPSTIIRTDAFLLVNDLQPLTVSQIEEQLDGLAGADQSPKLFTSLSFFSRQRPLGPTARPVLVIVAEHGNLLTPQGPVTTTYRPRPMLSRLGFGDARPKDVRICAYHSGAYHNLGMHELPENDAGLPAFLTAFLPVALPGAVALDLTQAAVRVFEEERSSWAKVL